jgi:hypothetical protein
MDLQVFRHNIFQDFEPNLDTFLDFIRTKLLYHQFLLFYFNPSQPLSLPPVNLYFLFNFIKTLLILNLFSSKIPLFQPIFQNSTSSHFLYDFHLYFSL